MKRDRAAARLDKDLKNGLTAGSINWRLRFLSHEAKEHVVTLRCTAEL